MAKATHKPKAADPVEENLVPVNVATGSPTQQADHNEEQAFKKYQKEGYNPNVVQNREAVYMTEKQAKELVKQYEKGEYVDEPAELTHAKRVLKHSK